jgi:hypothetical protein
MVEEGLSSEAKALELRLASVVDADRAGLLAVGEGRQEVGQPGVGAVGGDEPLDVVAPAPAAPLAGDGERRLALFRSTACSSAAPTRSKAGARHYSGATARVRSQGKQSNSLPFGRVVYEPRRPAVNGGDKAKHH